MFLRSVTALAATVAAVASITPASAADLPAPTHAFYSPTPVMNWTGFYIGVHGGGGWGDQLPNTPATFSISGPYVGAQAGYNWQFGGGWVVGIEGDVSWSGVNGVRSPPVAPFTTTEDIDWFGTIRGRIGYAWGNWLPYFTAGWAYSSNTRTNSGGLGGTATANHSGWTVGVGAEWMFAQNWTAKAEYKYIDFGSATYNFQGGGVSQVDVNLHTLELGLNYKF